MKTLCVVVAMSFIVLLASCGGSIGITDTINGDGSKQASNCTFGASWNSHCAQCNFSTNYTVSTATTLGDMYSGANFTYDIAVMDLLISLDLGESSGLLGASYEALYIFYDGSGDGIED